MEKPALHASRRVDWNRRKLDPESGRGRDTETRVQNLVDLGVSERAARMFVNIVTAPRRHLGSDRDPTSKNPLRRYGSHLTGGLLQSALFGTAGYHLGPAIAQAISSHRGEGSAPFDPQGPRTIGALLGVLVGALPNVAEYLKSRKLGRPWTDVTGKPLSAEDIKKHRELELPTYKGRVTGTPNPLFMSTSDWPDIQDRKRPTDIAEAWRS